MNAPRVTVEITEANGMSVVLLAGRKLCAGTDPVRSAARVLLARGYPTDLLLTVRDGDGENIIGPLQGLAR